MSVVENTLLVWHYTTPTVGASMQVEEKQGLSLEALYERSEAMRRGLFARHTALVKELHCQKEQVEWLTEKLMRVERLVEREGIWKD